MSDFRETHIIKGVPVQLSGGAGYDENGTIRFERDQVGRWYENGQPIPQSEVVILDMEGGPIVVDRVTEAQVQVNEPPALIDMPPKLAPIEPRTSRTFRLTEAEWAFLHRHGVEPAKQIRADLALLMRLLKKGA